MGRMGELDPLSRTRNGKWVVEWVEVEVEVLKCSGQTESPALKAQVGAASSVQEESRRGCRIWAITLFGLQGSYLFARFDMFLSSGGAVQYGKPIALKCIYLLCRQSSQTEQGWGEELEIRKLELTERERETIHRVFRRVVLLSFVLACCALTPVELWVDERTCPPSACMTSRTTTRCWLLTSGGMRYVLIQGSVHNHLL